MNVRPITPEFAVSPQVEPEDLRTVRELGFRAIVVARPDGEEVGQPTIDQMRHAATEAGLGFAAVPIRPGHATDADVASFSAAMKSLEGPVLGYCRTGMRAATLWALNASEALEPEVILNTVATAGHDLATLAPRLTERHDAASEARTSA